MLHGHLYVDAPPPWMEHIDVNGHSYILHGPLSALLCLPFVAMGITDQRLICCLLGLVAALLCYRFTRSGWLTAFFVFGTTFLYECVNGAAWDFALVATTPFTFAALMTGSGWWAGLAALGRYDLALAWPVYVWKFGIKVLPGLLAALAVYVLFNEARFGTLADHSVQTWYWTMDSYRAQRSHGPFSIYYLPYNLYTLLFMAPAYQDGFPWLRPQFMGQALLSLSPAFLLTKFGPWLIAAALVSLPALTVYANGFSQLGCRYYVQVFPFLIATMKMGTITSEAKKLICASILLSMSATAIVWSYGLAV